MKNLISFTLLVLVVVLGGGCSFNARLGGGPVPYGYGSGGGPYGYGGGGYPVISVPLESQEYFQAQTAERYGLGGERSGSYMPTRTGSYSPTPMR